MAIDVSTERCTNERMTAELPAETRYELSDFHLLEMPSSKPKQLRVLLNLYDSVKPFIKSQKLGEIFSLRLMLYSIKATSHNQTLYL